MTISFLDYLISKLCLFIQDKNQFNYTLIKFNLITLDTVFVQAKAQGH